MSEWSRSANKVKLPLRSFKNISSLFSDASLRLCWMVKSRCCFGDADAASRLNFDRKPKVIPFLPHILDSFHNHK